MISCDTNILFPVCNRQSPHHERARGFLQEHTESSSFCICEQVLMELYCLLRNPSVCTRPLTATEAVEMIQAFRSNPRWRIVDMVPGYRIMDDVWDEAATASFAYRRIFDERLARVLLHHGVDSFATRNLSDFRNAGFERLWDPLA